jgi:septal ring factor EnvC (AmiA/AmiB activator)
VNLQQTVCGRAERLRFAALALCLALAAIVPAHTQDRSRVQDLARRAAERIRALQREADSLAAQEKTLLVELRQLELQRQIRAEEVAKLGAEAEAVAGELARAEQRAVGLEQQIEDQRPMIEQRIVELYKLGRAGYLRMMLDVEDIRSVGRAYRTVSVLSRLDRERVDEHRRTLDALATTRKTLTARQAELQRLQRDATRARAAVDRLVASRSTLIRQIDERRDLTARLAGELQVAHQKLQASLAAMAAGQAASVPLLPLRPFQGDLPWPAPGRVAARFGRQPAGSRFAGTIRNGIEIAAAEGAPVHVVHGGTVAFADTFTGFGRLVIVEHGADTYSLYGYLSSTSVAKGDHVDRHALLGLVGTSPLGSPGLYFELRIDGKPVDPLQWLKR